MVDSRRMDFDNRTYNVDVSKLCRICALQDEHVIPIFEGNGLDFEFEVKLFKYLSLKVSKDDSLPHQICVRCSNTLLDWHKLNIGIKDAEKRLQSMLSKAQDQLEDNDEVILIDDTQDSVEILSSPVNGKNTTAHKSLEPSTNIPRLGKLTSGPSTVKKSVTNLQKASKDAGRTVKLVPSNGKSQPAENEINIQPEFQLMGQVTISDSPLTSPGRSVTVLPTAGNSQAVENTSDIVPVLQSILKQLAVIVSPTGSGSKIPVGKCVVLGPAKRKKTTLKPFLMSCSDNSISAEPLADSFKDETSLPTTPVPATSTPKIVAPSTTIPTIAAPANTIPIITAPATTLPRPNVPTTTVPITSVPSTNFTTTSTSSFCLPSTNLTTTFGPSPYLPKIRVPSCFSLPMTNTPTATVPILNTGMANKPSTKVLTLLIPGFNPQGNPFVQYSNNQTPVVTIPHILPEQIAKQLTPDSIPPANPLTQCSNNQNSVITPPEQPAKQPMFSYDPAHKLATTVIDSTDVDDIFIDDSPLPCLSETLISNKVIEEKTSMDALTGTIQDAPKEINKAVSEETEPSHVIAHEDHRYSKSLKILSERPSKSKRKDGGTVRLLDGLIKKSNKKGCFVCGKMIHNITLLSTHERSHFRSLTWMSYNCIHCKKSFKTFEEMIQHRKEHKGQRKKQPPKPKNPPGTSSARNLKRSALANGDEIPTSEAPKPKSRTPPKKTNEIKPHIKCVICGLCFKNKTELNDHKSSHTEEERANPYLCETCGKRFANNNSYRHHLKTHSGCPGELCSQCGKVFKLRSTYVRHLRLCHSVSNPWPTHQCEYCHKKFDSKARLLLHSNSHTGERPFACTKCDKAFHNPSNLKQHLACHADARPCMCDICGKTFKWWKNLKQHSLTHENIKENPVHCDLCGKKLTGERSVRMHKYRFHRKAFFLENPNAEMLPCQLCNKILTSTFYLEHHMNKFHPDGGLPFSCNVCGKRFTTKKGRDEHQRLHTGERPYACNICGKTFPVVSYLKAHIPTHSDERPHQCKYCGKQYKRKAHLDNHLRSHTGVKPYTCEVCDRAFAQRNDMLIHRTTHFDDKPFQCTFCESIFKLKRDLYQHLAKHFVSEPKEVEEVHEIDDAFIIDADDADANLHNIVTYEVG